MLELLCSLDENLFNYLFLLDFFDAALLGNNLFPL